MKTMACKLIKISGEELANKILKGERNFTHIELIEPYDLTPRMEELNEYLTGVGDENLRKNSIDISYSVLKNLIAENAYLPYLKAKETDLERVNIKAAYLHEADLEGVKAELANLWRVDFWRANLKKADLEKADINSTYFWRTDIRGVKNLEHALNLSYAFFYWTIVTKREKEIIEKVLEENRLERFDERENYIF